MKRAIAALSLFAVSSTGALAVQALAPAAQNSVAIARKAADALVALVPGPARALHVRGLVALQTGDATGAAGDFKRLLGQNSSYAVALYDLALTEVRLGKLDEAERELRSAIAHAPDYTRARLVLGSVLLRAGKRDEARTAFDHAAKGSQDLALRNLGLSLRNAIP